MDSVPPDSALNIRKSYDSNAGDRAGLWHEVVAPLDAERALAVNRGPAVIAAVEARGMSRRPSSYRT